MKTQKHTLKERICALVIATAMMLTWVMPNFAMIAQAEDGIPADTAVVTADGNGTHVPSESAADPAVPQVSYTLVVTDEGNQPLSDVMVSAKTTGHITGNRTDKNGSVTLTLLEQYTYEVSLSKTGYASVPLSIEAVADMPTGSASMNFADITMTADKNTATVGDTVTCTVDNPADGVEYTWSVTGDGATPASGTGTSFAVTCGKAGTVNVKVEAKGKSAEQNITVNKKIIDTNGIITTLAPENGTDVSKVTATVSGFPADATGNVTATFTYQGKDIDQTRALSKGSVEFTLNAEGDDVIYGNLTCSISYSGDDKYNGFQDKKTGTVNYKKSVELGSDQKIKLDIDEDGDLEEVFGQEITYGEYNNNTIELKSIEGRQISYSLDDESKQIVTVDENGKITLANKPGTAKVIVTAAENTNYTADTMEYYIVAKPKEITVAITRDLTVDGTSQTNEPSKIYDGNSKMTVDLVVASSLTSHGQDGKSENPDMLKITGIEGTLWNRTSDQEDASVKSDGIQINVSSLTEDKQSSLWYQITYDDNETEAILEGTSVTRRTLYLGTEDAKVPYSTHVAEDIEALPVTVVDNTVNNPDSGFAAGEKWENVGIDLPYAKLDTAALGDDYDSTTGTVAVTEEGKPYTNVIVPNITTADSEGSNYHLEAAPAEHFGDLTVEQEKLEEQKLFEALNITAVNPAEGTPAPEKLYRPNKNEIYVNGSENGTELRFSIDQVSDPDLAKRYDKVTVEINGVTNGFVDAKDGVVFKAEEGTVYEGTIRFVKAKWENKPSAPKVEAPIKIRVDAKDPTFSFGEGWKETKVAQETLAQLITFNHYKKSHYSIAGVSAAEDETADSGVMSQFYYVWKLGDDNTTEDINGAAVQAKVEELAGSTANWTELSGTEIPVVKEKSGLIEDLQGQYVVLVKVSDNVGHAAVYASNGVIIEVTEPSISISGVDSEAYYNADVPYTINVADTDNKDKAVTSGIDTVKVQIVCDGETTSAETYKIGAENSEETLKQILDMSVFEITGEVEAQYNNSNDVKIVVNAYDKAGNKALEAVQPLHIDITKPEITVSYDNNAAVNGTYFADKRVMTVQYRERNFDENRATFAVTAGELVKEDAKFSELGAFGIGYKLVSDVEGKTPDDRLITYQLTFDKDNDYKIVPSCTDFANNANDRVDYGKSAAPNAFTIDTTDPVIDVKYYIEGSEVEVSAEEAARLYTQKAVRVTVSVTEHNFGFDEAFSEDPKQMNLTVGATEELKDQEVDTAAYAKQADVKTKWTRDIDMYTKSFDFTLDANYSFALGYKDLAGRSASYAPHYFTVDDTKPEGMVSYEVNGQRDTWWNLFLNLITFNRFSNKNIPVSFDSRDTTAGVATMEYYKAYEPMTKEAAAKITDWTAGNGFSVDPNEQFVPYLRVTDKAGNVDYFSSEFAVVADDVAAGPEIEITAANPAHGIYNGNVPFHISVTDPTAGNTYAGLAEVYYEVRKDGAVTQSGNYNAELQPASSRVKNLEKDETVNAELNNSNDVEIYVKAVDNAGNTAEATQDLKIDITDPTIQVTYDLNSPLNGKYYKDIRTATVVVTERNFDESAVRFNITNTDGTRPSISGWSHSADSGVSDNATHTCQVSFAADGDYTFTMNTTDLAGNDSNYTQVDEFTIDRTVPVIEVSYDNNSAATPGYYNADRTALITITEHNFNAAEVNAQITAALQGSGVAAPGVGGWSSLGDAHTASVTFSADADYTFDIEYTDLAGNAAADYTQDSFTVDKTKPEIEFFDIENESANNGTVAPGVRYSDVNYTADGVNISITGAKHKTAELSGNRVPIANGESIKMSDFARNEETDDVYTMSAVIRDKAGNETEEEIRFSVNRFGSNYIFSEETAKFLKNVYSSKEQDIVVTEINVDTLVFNGISYGLDGTKKTLKQGQDYTVKQSGGEGSWKEYTYTIDKENFEKEGRYSVTIDSEDKATNKTNNKVKECAIDFVIDKTAPTLVITGIEESSYREDARDMTVNVSDNTAVKRVEVMIDGESAAVYDQTVIEKANGKIDYTIESASAPQNIEAVAVDMANNETVSEVHEVLVTSNLFIQYINNIPLLIGSIIGVIVIAGGCIWFFVIRKKKNTEK